MPNLYETMIGAPPSGPDETAAAARALRGQQQLGQLGILTGDRVLSPMGQSMVKNVQEKTEGLQQARQKEMVEQRERDRQEATEKNWAASQTLNQDKLAEDRRWHDMQAERYKIEDEAKEAAKQTAADAKSTERLGKEMNKMAELRGSMEVLDSLLMPHLAENPDVPGRMMSGGNVPGIGYGETIRPNWTRGEVGDRIAAAAQDVSNQILQKRSGAAVTPSEAERLNRAIQLLATSSEENFLERYQDMRTTFNSVLQNAYAGFPQGVVDMYQERGGVSKLTSLSGPVAPVAPQGPQGPQGPQLSTQSGVVISEVP